MYTWMLWEWPNPRTWSFRLAGLAGPTERQLARPHPQLERCEGARALGGVAQPPGARRSRAVGRSKQTRPTAE